MSATDRAEALALEHAADFRAAANLRLLLNPRAATDLRDTSGKTALGYPRRRRDRNGRVVRACRCGRIVDSDETRRLVVHGGYMD